MQPPLTTISSFINKQKIRKEKVIAANAFCQFIQKNPSKQVEKVIFC